MGCHTWFATKSKYSLEELRSIWITQQEKKIEHWEKNSETIKEVVLSSAWDQKYYEWQMKLFKRQLRMVRNGNIKCAFVNHVETDEGDIYEMGNGVVYCNKQDLPHDLFRCGYTDTKLFSLAETLAYLDDPKNQCTEFPDTRERLLRFWEQYPDSMISFE